MLRLLLRRCRRCLLRQPQELLLMSTRPLPVAKWRCCHQKGTDQRLMHLPPVERKQYCLQRGRVLRMLEWTRIERRQTEKVRQSQSSRKVAR